jgi:hypothetical protein
MKKYNIMLGGAIGINGTPVKTERIVSRLNTFEELKLCIKKEIYHERLTGCSAELLENILQKEYQNI